MLHGWLWCPPPGVFFLIVVLSSRLAWGGFEVRSHDVEVDAAARETTFSVTFTAAPDFFHTDAFGRPRESFQYFYDAQPGGFEFAGRDVAIIRGAEIRFDHRIPVRDSLNPTGEEFPHAEGWGPMRGEVDYALDGSALTFTVPWDVLGETDGKFSYRLLAFVNGSETADVSMLVIPLPGAWSGAALLVLATGVWVRWMKRQT